MNADKLKNQCQFCKHYLDDVQVMNCAQIHVICKSVQSTWELHPDIAEAMQPETTELETNSTHHNNVKLLTMRCLDDKHLFSYYWKHGKCKGSKCSICGYVDKSLKPNNT